MMPVTRRIWPSLALTLAAWCVIGRRWLAGVLLALPLTCSAYVAGEFSGFTWPQNLTADANGDVWFTSADNQLRRISPGGAVTAFALPAGRSFVSGGGIVAAPDGSIWMASSGLIRRSPDGIMTEHALPTTDVPVALTLGPDGNVWFTTSAAGPIGRITSAGSITLFHVGASIDYSPVSSIAAGPDGNLWFATSAYGGIGRISVSGTVTRFQVTASATASYGGIVPGADGNMWFADVGNSRIGRITTAGSLSYFSVPSLRRGGNSLTTGPDGRIWFQLDSGRFGAMSTDGVLSELDLLGTVDEPAGLTANFTTSPDGLIWFTRYLPGRIGMIWQGTTGGFFPMPPGASWTYTLNGMSSAFTRTVTAGTSNINGVETTLLGESTGGGRYMSNDASGIREHRQVDGLGNILTFSPPLLHADNHSLLGTSRTAMGTVSGTFSGSPFSLPYTNSTLMEGLELVSTPAGSFRAVRLRTQLFVNGSVTDETDWLANGVGLVKGESDGDTYLLQQTSMSVTSPDSFGYAVPPAAPPATRNTFTVTGITATAPISIAGGQYSVNGGAYVSTPGTVSNGQTVTVQPTALLNAYVKQAVVSIGGVTGAFNALVPQAPAASLSTSSLVYADQAVGSTSVAQVVTLTNVGNAVMNISVITVTGEFVRSTDCGTTLAPAASCTISVGFAPTGMGARNETLSVFSDAPGSPHTATLAGTGVAPDIQAPTVPAGLVATAPGWNAIQLGWSAASDNVAVVIYRVYRDAALLASVSAPATGYLDATLAAASTYSYSVAACDAAGNCSAASTPVTATTPAAGGTVFTPVLQVGFNLLGNSLNTVIDPMSLFGNQTSPTALSNDIASVWKWDAIAGKWQFHSPLLSTAANAAYAASHNYDVLTGIAPGEGYWVNALNARNLPAQSGSPFDWNSLGFAALPPSWNLLANGTGLAPRQFNINMADVPPSPGQVVTSFTSLWAWDATNATWFFYSPLLEAQGGLAAVKSYADSHAFLHFEDFNKLLDIGVGFWVNRF